MLLFKSYIASSKIPNAGKGLFTEEFLPKGKVVVVPNQEHKIYSADKISQFEKGSLEYESAIRWFEDRHTIDLDWSEESHLNHSFTPNLLWHLGFMFAVCDISPHEELTINYSYLLDENTKLDICDSITGNEISGMPFNEKMVRTSQELLAIFSTKK